LLDNVSNAIEPKIVAFSSFAQRFPVSEAKKNSRNGTQVPEWRRFSSNIWILREILTAVEPQNLAIPLFAQHFRVPED
jgi:hypothetical protein